MRHEFDLDHLCTYAVESADPKHLVSHPERARLEEQIKTTQASVDRVVGRRGHLKPGGKMRVQGRTFDEEAIDDWICKHQDEIRRLKARVTRGPRRSLSTTSSTPSRSCSSSASASCSPTPSR